MVLAGISYTTSVIHIEPDEITRAGMILLFPRVICLRIAISPIPICAAKWGLSPSLRLHSEIEELRCSWRDIAIPLIEGF
jgi:hypothetical protein